MPGQFILLVVVQVKWTIHYDSLLSPGLTKSLMDHFMISFFFVGLGKSLPAFPSCPRLLVHVNLLQLAPLSIVLVAVFTVELAKLRLGLGSGRVESLMKIFSDFLQLIVVYSNIYHA